jgi:maleylpyruvate isomerase
LDDPVNNVTRLPQLEEAILATTRYLAALTELTDDDCRAPSALPGWSRGHVIAHLSRNADGLSNLLHWAQTGVETTMYVSIESRDADIEAGSGLSADELRADASASCGRFLQAANEVHRSQLSAMVARTPGSPPFEAYRVGGLRRNEVEIHHADLLIGYTAHDWPADFTRHLLDRRAAELAEDGHAMTWRVTDLAEPIVVGAGGTEVRGSAADLAWWLIGRGTGEGVTAEEGDLPTIGKWV